MNALDLVRKDHRELRALLDGAERRPAALERLRGELEVHMRVEEEFLYPALEKSEDLVREALEQHEIIDEILRRMDPASNEFEARLRELRKALEEHWKTEEGDVFEEIGANMAPERLEELGEEMESRKEALFRIH